MDNKQQNIFNKICKYNNIVGEKIVFKQFRNLNEFKFFQVERINPTHKIKLMGKPRRKYIYDGHYNKIINVGEILIYSALTILVKADILLFWLNCFLLTLFCIHLCLFENPYKVFKYYVNWYRRRFGVWKNCLCR